MKDAVVAPAMTLIEGVVFGRSYNITNIYRRDNTYPTIDCG